MSNTRTRRNLLALIAVVAGLAGMSLGFGIMGYEALVNGKAFTTISWVLIAPVWSGAVALWLLGLFRSRVFLFPMLMFAGAGGTYYGDVHGQFPALALIGLAMLEVAADWHSRQEQNPSPPGGFRLNAVRDD